ncbi:hypothetical protein AB834_02015 [PVC group bacterium (ex Bugula neritina AB1)]|nr:hypothetical protein AB834_02015 [PVC group bacterium (ex Bugula neritina AB1)]
MFKLERPLVMFDLETTGTSVSQDRIVQIAVVKIYPDGKKEEFEWLVNPERPIPEDAAAIHGISDEDVIFARSFKDLSYDILKIFKDCDLGGYNAIKFDIPFLCNEFKRVGIDFSLDKVSLVDPYVVYRTLEPHTLGKAYQYYCKKNLEGAHSALPDARASWDVLQAQSEMYEDLPKDISKVVEFCQSKKRGNSFDQEGRLLWVKSELVINFGKHKGTSLRELAKGEKSYLEWIVTQDFSEDVKGAILQSLEGKCPKR